MSENRTGPCTHSEYGHSGLKYTWRRTPYIASSPARAGVLIEICQRRISWVQPDLREGRVTPDYSTMIARAVDF